MHKDSIGQEVKVGDYIAYKPARQATNMEHGQIVSFTKSGIPEVDDMDGDFSEDGLPSKSIRTIFVKTFIQKDI
jgi:hypothetical protein